MGAHLLHPHPARLPGPGAEAALHRDFSVTEAARDRPLQPGPQRGHQQEGQQQQAAGANASRWVHGLGARGAASTLRRPDGRRRAGCQDLTNAPQPVPLFHARVQVSLRPSVLDPAGEATRAAAGRLGVEGVRRLRIGKAIEVDLEAADAETARAQLALLSDRLLANPVIEDWTLDLREAI